MTRTKLGGAFGNPSGKSERSASFTTSGRKGWLVPACLACAFPASALAQEAAPTQAVDLSAEWTQFLSSAVAGSGDSSPRYGGRLDGYAKIDGAGAGLWDGLTINAHAEFVYGENVNRVGSALLLPVNTALSVPATNGEAFDFSLNVVQRIGKVRIQAGKINLIDASAGVPIVRGSGKVGFQHIGIAASPGLIASPKILGAIATVPLKSLVLTAGLWTPEDWTRQYDPNEVFKNGSNVMLGAMVPTKFGGLQGFHTVTVYVTSKRFKGLANQPDIRPPEGAGKLLPDNRGGAHVRYSVQQYLWQDPANPKRGWGLFGHAGISTGVPGVIDWSMSAGIAGSVPLETRPEDSFGLGYFRMALRRRLVNGLESILPLSDEQGFEAYYSAQAGYATQFTLTGQIVDPVISGAPVAGYLGIRTKTDF